MSNILWQTSALTGANPPSNKVVNMAEKTHAFELVNKSHWDITVTSDIAGSRTTLPPFSTKIYSAYPGEQVIFNCVQSTFPAQVQNAEEVVLNQISIPQESPITPLANVPTYTTGVNISSGSVGINETLNGVQVKNAVQTNALVHLGQIVQKVTDLANTKTVYPMFLGTTTGYFNTLVLEATSANGYTYTAAANAFNRNTNIGAFTMGTQNNGSQGEFYVKGTLSARETFSNVQVPLKADVTSASTIFQDPISSLTNWKVDSGSATFGSAGASITANGTAIEETTQTGLVPQNLTLKADYTVANTQVVTTGNFTVGSNTTSYSLQAGYSVGNSFTVNQDITITDINAGVVNSGEIGRVELLDASGNVLAYKNGTSNTSTFFSGTIDNTVNLKAGTTYWMVLYNTTSSAYLFYAEDVASGYTSSDGTTTLTPNTALTTGSGDSPINGSPETAASAVLLFTMNFSYTTGSHTTVGTEYRKDSTDYYKLEWNAGSLNLTLDSGGSTSTLATTSTNETNTDVTMQLVIASNGNITGTMTGSTTTQVTATDTTITSGSMAVTGDSGATVSNAFISGNYIPSDTVTIDLYAN